MQVQQERPAGDTRMFMNASTGSSSGNIPNELVETPKSAHHVLRAPNVAPVRRVNSSSRNRNNNNNNNNDLEYSVTSVTSSSDDEEEAENFLETETVIDTEAYNMNSDDDDDDTSSNNNNSSSSELRSNSASNNVAEITSAESAQIDALYNKRKTMMFPDMNPADLDFLATYSHIRDHHRAISSAKEEELAEAFADIRINTAEELGMTAEELEMALPLPPTGAFSPMLQRGDSGNNFGSLQRTQSDSHASISSTTSSSISNSSNSNNSSPRLQPRAITTPGRELDPTVIDLFLRCYRSASIEEADRRELTEFIFNNTPANVELYQSKALYTFTGVLLTPKQAKANEKLANFIKKKKGSMTYMMSRNMKLINEIPSAKLSKYNLTFGHDDGTPCETRTLLTEEFTVKNKGKQPVKFSFHQPPVNEKLSVKIIPMFGELKKGAVTQVKVEIFIKKPHVVRELLIMDVEGGAKYFVSIRLEPKLNQFGVDPHEMDTIQVNGVQIPTLLFQLKSCLLENDGLRREGIFRKAGSEKMIQQVKHELNTGQFTGCDDVHVVASLIKIWFRELPQAILSSHGEKKLTELKAEDEQQCINILNELPEPNKSLFLWLIDLMCDVVKHKEHNKMDAKNIAIVVSPNLYTPTTDNPMVLIMLAQKLTQIVNVLILQRLKQTL